MLSYDVAGYFTSVSNDIVPYRGGRFYFTAGTVHRTGTEFGVNARLAHGLAVAGALTLSKNTYVQYVVDSVHYGRPGHFADYSGNLMVGVPKVMFNGNVSWAPPAAGGLRFQLGMQQTGSYYADDANTVSVPSSVIFSAGLLTDRVLELGNGVGVRGFVTVQNLADRKYIGSAFLNPDVVNGKPVAFEPGLPRQVLRGRSVSVGDGTRPKATDCNGQIRGSRFVVILRHAPRILLQAHQRHAGLRYARRSWPRSRCRTSASMPSPTSCASRTWVRGRRSCCRVAGTYTTTAVRTPRWSATAHEAPLLTDQMRKLGVDSVPIHPHRRLHASCSPCWGAHECGAADFGRSCRRPLWNWCRAHGGARRRVGASRRRDRHDAGHRTGGRPRRRAHPAVLGAAPGFVGSR